MTFLYPLALLGLIAIPILIIIYIIRNKYKEVTAPTTYIWEVAAKFLKRKNPFSRFEHLIALLVQIAAITILSFALAHPVITLKEAADNIVFVLDASASMNTQHEGMSRFDKAKVEIAEKAEQAASGSTYTLILAETEPRIVCQNVNDLSRFQMYLDSVKCTDESTHIADAIASAQVLFSSGDCNLCYLATDQVCEEMPNISHINVTDDEQNYAITALDYEHEAKQISFSGTLVSYESDTELNLEILINGTHFKEMSYQVVKGEPYTFTTKKFDYNKTVNSVTVKVQNADGKMDDNTYTVYANDTTVNTKVLVVSSASTYLRSIFSAMKNVTYTIVSPAAYHDTEGYDLYVFDNYSPASLPATGAVMMFGLSRTVSGSGFLSSSTVTPSGGATLEFANNDSLLYQQLTRNVLGNREIVISNYQRYSLYQDFTTILTCDNIPVLFAGRNENGQRQVVFAFDLHNSNLPLLYDYVAFMRNFVDYANPRLMNEFDYQIGDKAVIDIPDEVTSLSMETPDGKIEPIRYSGNESFAYTLSQIGSYTLTATYTNGTEKVVHFYSHNDYDESNPRPLAEHAYSLVVNENTVRGDGLLDNILPIVIAAALFFVGDWILYAHEQY